MTLAAIAAILPSQTVVEIFLINALLAYSAYPALSSGSSSFTFVAFVAFGAYTAAIANVDHGIGLVPAVLIACAVSALGGAALHYPLKRLSGIYLGLVSIAVVATVQSILVNFYSLTGGPAGRAGMTDYVGAWQLLAALVFVAAVFMVIQRRHTGLAIRAVRADPAGAATNGVHVERLYLKLAVASAVLAAFAGVMRAYYFGFVVPDDYGFPLLVAVVSMVVIGGTTHWTGPLIGAAVMTMVPEWLRPLGNWRDVIRGVILLVVVWWMPQGITGAIGRVRGRWVARRSLAVAPAEPARIAAPSAVRP
jgi:branched-chain amino acid transport system permease protein